MHLPSGQQMHMQVENGLAGIWPRIHNQSVAARLHAFAGSQLSRHRDHPADDSLVAPLQFQQRGDMSRWNHEEMQWGDRPYVAEGYNVAISIEDRGVGLAPGDQAEDARIS